MTGHSRPSRRRAHARPATVLLLSGLAACAPHVPPARPAPGGSGPGASPPAEDACVISVPAPARAAIDAVPNAVRVVDTTGAGAARDRADERTRPAVVAVAGPVDPGHAPVPRSAAERLVFAQLYQTLVRLDCRGEAVPLLARSWTIADAGRRWTFHLRPDARAWSGDAVGAADVLRNWLAGPAAGEVGALGVTDDSTLEVQLSRPVTAAFFARPELAVTLPGPPGGWPVGTGPYHPEPAPAGDTAGGLLLRSDSLGPAIAFRPEPGDLRNALDEGVDLLVTRDPAALAYAAASGEYQQVALPWDRVYLLVVPDPSFRGRLATPTDAELRALAHDAVRVSARPAALTSSELDACADTAPPPGSAAVEAAAGNATIVYPREDAAAAGLAQRLVALARAGGTEAWVAAALAGRGSAITAEPGAGTDFGEALRRGAAAAFLLPVQRTAATGACELLAEARRRAPWLRAAQVLPLVETRATAVLREGVSGVTVDAMGTLLLGSLRVAGGRP